LIEADFSHATCNDADFSGADLQFARFHQVQGDYALDKTQQGVSFGTDSARLDMEKRLGAVA
jgi:uncharacterized protein YjbI with pentapeptide repeats